eukprot:NODE_1006_length_2716_cov_0.318303.p1 type:complete len:457 gc:universal NODE_1006_length_2716_cov_0.318303:2411-1041(-)
MDLQNLSHVFGILMKKDQWYPSPIASSPYPISHDQHSHLLRCQTLINQFKSKSLHPTHIERYIQILSSLNDSFINNLLKIRRKQQNPIQFGILRADYILDTDNQFKQVEVNCIASSFGYLSQQVSKCHTILHENIVKNECVITNALNYANDAWNEYYGNSKIENVQGNCILMMVQPTESNLADQYGLMDGLKIPMFRITFADVRALKLVDDNLYFTHKNQLTYLVTVIYYRCGYTPNDYPTESEWQSRSILENSNAINCPSVDLQLMGLKKIQQIMNKNELENYLKDNEIDTLTSSFMDMYSMDSTDYKSDDKDQLRSLEDVLNLIRTNPSQFVLKPQREGGSNNYYGNDILNHLQSIPETEYKQYILMRRIESNALNNTLNRWNLKLNKMDSMKGSTMSEIGIYGWFIRTKSKKSNDYHFKDGVGGYLVRSKLMGVNEGGVATGYSCLNSLQWSD